MNNKYLLILEPYISFVKMLFQWVFWGKPDQNSFQDMSGHYSHYVGHDIYEATINTEWEIQSKFGFFIRKVLDQRKW